MEIGSIINTVLDKSIFMNHAWCIFYLRAGLIKKKKKEEDFFSFNEVLPTLFFGQ